MVIVCKVEGCKTGTRKEYDKRKLQGLKSLSLFSVPKDEVLRKKWSDSLEQDLRIGDKICEKHFYEKDVVKYDKILLKNGVVDKIPRINYCVAKGAVPVKCPVEIPDSTESNFASDSQELSLSANSSLHSQKSMVLSTITSKVNNDLPSNISSSTNNDENAPKEATPPQKIIYIINQPKISNKNNRSLLHNICEFISTRDISSQWKWSMNHLEGLCFINLDLKTFEINYFFIVSPDLSLMAFTSDKKVSVKISNFQLQQPEDIFKVLKYLESFKFCKGFKSLIGKSRASNCQGVIVNTNDPLFKSITQCIECRKLLEETNQKFKLDNQDTKKKMKNFKQNWEHCKTKNKLLQEKIKKLNRKIFDMEKTILQNKISQLPVSHQETVKNCFMALSVASSKRSYSLQTIQYAVALRQKSKAAYDYIRQENLMILPSEETLSKYKKKFLSEKQSDVEFQDAEDSKDKYEPFDIEFLRS